MPLTVKLRSSIRTTDVSTQVLADPHTQPGPSEAALRMRRLRRQRTSEDHENHLRLERLRLRQYRQNMSLEKKKEHNEKAKMRMRKYRGKKTESKNSGNQKEGPHTRLSQEKKTKQKEKWVLQKRKWRASLSAQKKRRIRERDAAQKREQRAKQKHRKKRRREGKDHVTGLPGIPDVQESPSLYPADRTKLHRVRKTLKRSTASSYAHVVANLVKKVTPRKAVALRRSLGLGSSEVQQKGVINSVKDTLKSVKGARRRIIIGELAVNICQKKSTACKSLGLSKKIIQKYAKLKKSKADLQKRKMRSDAVGKKEQEIVRNFYKREDISTCVPNKKSVRGDGKARYILQRTLIRTFHLFKEEYSEISIGKSSFIKLKPKNVWIQSKARWNQCLCQVCTNVDLKLKRLNIELRSAGFQTITDRYRLSDETICKDSSVACIDRKCPKCGVHAIDKKVKEFLANNGTKQVSWKQWGQVEYAAKKKRVCLQTKTGSCEELVTCLKSELVSFPCHLFEAQWQQKQFATVSQSPPPFTVVTVMDFAENFTCAMQSEVQSAHWYQQQVTLHPSVSYYACQDSKCTNEKPVREAVHIVSSDIKHDAHAVAKFTEVISEHIKQRDPTLKNMIQFSDGCTGQYKSRVAFADLSFASSDLPFEQVQRNYFGSRHGKNACDGEGGVVKNAATRAIKSGTAVITDSDDFFDFCDKNLSKEARVNDNCNHSRRKFLKVDPSEICRSREHRTNVCTVPGTRKLHAVKGIAPYQIQTRRFSCFCGGCDAGGDCTNRQVVDDWKMQQVPLSTHGKADSGDDLEGEEKQNTDDLQGEETQNTVKIHVTVHDDDVQYTVHQDDTACDSEVTCGQFVRVKIPVDRKGTQYKLYAGEVKKILPSGELVIQYMEEVRPGVFKWPLSPDISVEDRSSVVVSLPNPSLLEDKSSTRCQYFSF